MVHWCHHSLAPTQALTFWLHGGGDEPVPHCPTDQTSSFPSYPFCFSHNHQEENWMTKNCFLELVYMCPISPFRLDQQSERVESNPLGMAAVPGLPDVEEPELGDNDIPGVTLEGLGVTWEKDDTIRARAVISKNLLAWPSPKHVGVINFTTAKQNVLVLSHLLELWCPQVPCAKTVNIEDVRAEVGWKNKILNLKCF